MTPVSTLASAWHINGLGPSTPFAEAARPGADITVLRAF